MNQAFRITASGLCACLLAGCGTSFPEIPRTESDVPAENPRAAIHAKIDEFVKNYVEPETDIPTVFAGEFEGKPEYAEMKESAQKAFDGIRLFKQSKNLKSIQLIYEAADKTKLVLHARKDDRYIEIFVEKDGKNLLEVSSELPDIKVRPEFIPQEQEEALCRDLFMIHSFLLNPQLLPKTVSMDTVKIMNVVKKNQQYENKEYLFDGHLCARMNINLRDMFGGGRMELFLSAGPSLEDLSGVSIPALTLDMPSDSAFSFSASDYAEVKKGLILPKVIRFRGKAFLLKSADADIILPPMPAPDPAKADGKDAVAVEAESAPDVKPEASKNEEEEAEPEVKSDAKDEEEAPAKDDDEEEEADEDEE